MRIAYVTYTKRALPISDYQQVSQIANIMRGDGAIVTVDNGLANGWAVYFLRQIPISLAKYRMYMASPNGVASLEKARTVSISNTRYLLTDSKDCFCLKEDMDLIWTGGPYNLWKFLKKDWAVIVDIRNPYGIGQGEMERGFWIGTKDTELDIVASKAGWVMLQASFSPGPSIPERLDRKILVLGEQGSREVITIPNAGFHAFQMPVVAGKNRFKLQSLDHPTVTQLPNGDPRPFLLGVRRLQVSFRDTPS
jgi:hypothetical protein